MRFKIFAVTAAVVASLSLVSSASALDFVQSTGSPYSTGELESNSVLTGDLNGDGRDDVVTVNADYSYSVFRAETSGALTELSGSPFATSTYAVSGTLGDFTNDGILDLAIASNIQVVVRPGTGTGTFAAPLPAIETTTNGESIAAGNFNGDANLDMAVAGFSNGTVQIIFGDGGGGLGSTVSVAGVGNGPVQVLAADFDGDGLDDFATANLNVGSSDPAPGAVSVLLNLGGGAFEHASGSPFAGTAQPRGLTSGDFNGDGDVDLAQVARSSAAMQLLYGDGAGGFAPGTGLPDTRSNWNNSAASADFNDDGFDDVLVGQSTNLVNPVTPWAPIFMGTSGTDLVESPDGPWSTTSPASPWTVATGDFNDDGRADWVSGDQGGRMSVFLNEVLGLTADPTSIAFGSRAAWTGPSDAETATFTSSGNATVTIPAGAATLTGPDADEFYISSDGCSSQALNPAQTCAVDVRFAPTSIGPLTATLEVASDAGGSPTTVALTGTGTANPGISIDPASHDFGDVRVGQGESEGGPVTFTAENTGTTALEISAVSLTGANAGQFEIDTDECSGESIPPEGDCDVEVLFMPTVIGAASAQLSFSTNVPGGPQTAALSGNGTPFAYVGATPEELDFGTRRLHEGPSAPRSFTVEAMGTTPLHITAVSVYTADFADFPITEEDCAGQTFEPGETCEVSIAFEPGAIGEREAFMRVQHDDGVAIYPVTGEGIDPDFSRSPASQDFGTRVVGEGAGEPRTFTLTSTGTTDLTTGEVSLEMAGRDQFQVISDGCSERVLAPGVSCEVAAAFAPTSAGEKMADLTIPLEGVGVTDFRLTGSGQDPLPPPTPCEPVAVKRVAYFTPKVKRRSNTTGVRARITTAAPADLRISSKVIYHLNGRQGTVRYAQREFRVEAKSIDYKVGIPKKLRAKLKRGKKVRFVVTYSSKSVKPECTEFGAEKTRSITTRIVKVFPNA